MTGDGAAGWSVTVTPKPNAAAATTAPKATSHRECRGLTSPSVTDPQKYWDSGSADRPAGPVGQRGEVLVGHGSMLLLKWPDVARRSDVRGIATVDSTSRQM